MFLILSISFLILAIILILVYIYLKNDEKNIKQVSSKVLTSYGKHYSSNNLSNNLFLNYTNIITATLDNNYDFLKDLVSDDIYNQILLNKKNNYEKNINEVVDGIKKEFSKLIDYRVVNDLEIAKVWVKYKSYEYSFKKEQLIDDKKNVLYTEEVISGSKDTSVNNEYILTFVKNKEQKETLTCPGCGYQTNMLLTSRCIRCGNEIVSKKLHWVYVGKEKI